MDMYTFFSVVTAKATANVFTTPVVREEIMCWLVVAVSPVNLTVPSIGPRNENGRTLIDHEKKYTFHVQDVTMHSGKLDYGTLYKYLDKRKPNSGY